MKTKQADTLRWSADRCVYLALFKLRERSHAGVSCLEARAELKKELEGTPQGKIEELAEFISRFEGGIKSRPIFGEILEFLLALKAGALDPVPEPTEAESKPEPEAATA